MAERDTRTARSEQRAVRAAFVAASLVIAAFVASKAARDAILLSTFDISRFPMFVAISAALSLPVVMVAGRLLARHGPHRLLPLLNVLSAALLVGEWGLLQERPRIAAVLVFLHLGSLGAVLVSGFWSIVTERFDVQSAKRYAGRIGVGATVGGIIGGVIAERTAVYLAPGSILLVLAGLQLVSAIALSFLARGDAPRRGSTHEVARLSALRTIARVPLLRTLAVVVVLGAVSAAALDFVFKAEVMASTDGHPLRMFAVYHTAISVLTAAVQLVVGRYAVTRLGLARSVVTLPLAVTGFGLVAFAVPGLVAATVARGAEAIARSSIYRAGYELMFAPMLERDKRSTKVVLDVGAERVGDLIGSQLVALILAVTTMPRLPVIASAVVVGAVCLVFASRLPKNYMRALESSLVERAGARPEADDMVTWTMFGAPTMSESGAHMSMLSLFDLGAEKRREIVPKRRSPPGLPAPPMHAADPAHEGSLLEQIRTLRGRDVSRVREVLHAGVAHELVVHVVPLLAWNEVARDAHRALTEVAPKCTGALVDVLLDQTQEFTVRRRLPAVLAAGEPQLAVWGLWRGLADARFEVRYRCGRALGELRARGHTLPCTEADVYALVDRELSVEAEVMRNYRLIDSDPEAVVDHPEVAVAAHQPPPTALAHIFNLLGLALPAEPVRIAFHGLHTQDRDLRATVLEYLESALPSALAARLMPLIEVERPPQRSARSQAELTAALQLSAPKIEARLAELRDSRA